jgi:hypothetical protein
VRPFGLGDGTIDSDMVNLAIIILHYLLVLKSVFEPPVIVSMLPWVRKFSICSGGF